jgi:2-keto-3-deoxy-L-rhamnonate aldolase RhmA
MRIYSSEPGFITRVFDLGMNGIVVPHVNTKADAERIVQAAKFAPVGLRGMYRGRQAFGRPSDYFQQANDETIIIVLIEEIQAVENLSEILTVDHIDVFFVAPGDLAQTMGYIGQPAHPEVQVVIDDALRQIVAAGRVAGALGNEETLGRYASLGVRFFLINYDAWIRQAAQEYLSGVAGLSQPG